MTISLDEKAMKGKENISAEWSKNKVEVIYNEWSGASGEV